MINGETETVLNVSPLYLNNCQQIIVPCQSLAHTFIVRYPNSVVLLQNVQHRIGHSLIIGHKGGGTAPCFGKFARMSELAQMSQILKEGPNRKSWSGKQKLKQMALNKKLLLRGGGIPLIVRKPFSTVATSLLSIPCTEKSANAAARVIPKTPFWAAISSNRALHSSLTAQLGQLHIRKILSRFSLTKIRKENKYLRNQKISLVHSLGFCK